MTDRQTDRQTDRRTGYPSQDRPWEKGASFTKRHPYIPNLNIYSILRLINAHNADTVAIDCKDIQKSYKELFEDSKRYSCALKKLGANAGSVVTVCMPNIYEAVVTFLACNRLGVIVTFLNPGAEDEEIIDYLNKFNTRIYVNYDKSDSHNQRTLAETKVENVIYVAKGIIEKSTEHIIAWDSLHRLFDVQKGPGWKWRKKKESALILYTSGSTGQPKAVVLTNENVMAALIYAKNTSTWSSISSKKMLVCVPFAYPYGFVTSLLSALFAGRTAILAPDIGKDTVAYYYAKKPDMIFGSPALLDLTMRYVPDEMDMSQVTHFISGGDFLTPSHQEKGRTFFERHGAKTEIGNGSGNAETVSCGTTPVGIKLKPETAGKILVGSTAMVVDVETMSEKRYGEEGMLCISGKHVFREYYADPVMTREAKFAKDGREYFKTGTNGFIDEDGYFTLTGRSSRFYIMSSLDKVYLDHVQSVISRFECVEACAVVKVKDEDLLFVNKAIIVPEDNYRDKDNLKDIILDLCKKPVTLANGKTDQLKVFEIPAYIELIDELPRKSGTDKIDYRMLEKQE